MEDTKFRVRRDLEQLAMGEVESPNEYLSRAYVLAEQMKEAVELIRLTPHRPLFILCFLHRETNAHRAD